MKVKSTRKFAKKRVYRKRKYVSKTKNVNEYASCTVMRTVAATITNQMYSYDGFQLADYQRAVQVAGAYQRYRMSGITITWKPAYDTYAQGGPLQKPNLYYIIDKPGAIPDNITLEALKQMGAKAIAFDEKPLHVSFKPATLGEELNTAGANSAAGYKVSPWLTTNANATNALPWAPSTVAHQGIKWYMEQAGGNTQVNVEVKVQFEFCKPLLPSLAATPALGLTYAKLDASPDGVEGGTDGITIPLQA